MTTLDIAIMEDAFNQGLVNWQAFEAEIMQEILAPLAELTEAAALLKTRAMVDDLPDEVLEQLVGLVGPDVMSQLAGGS